jgi:hypothetical protein
MAHDRDSKPRRGGRGKSALRASAVSRMAVSIALAAMMACGDGDPPDPTGVDQPAGATDPMVTAGTVTPAAVTPAAVTPAATPPGIVFSSSQLPLTQLNSVNTGLVYTPTPSNLLSFLSQVKSKNGRVLIKLAGGENTYKNSDGSFNLDKWKAGVARYKSVAFGSYVSDGTIVGHFLVDEPHFDGRWGGKVIPQATLEEMAKYSKSLYPTLITLVNAPANYLTQATVSYVYLDAAWAMYRSKTSSSPGTWVANQASKARSKGLGLVAGMNVLDGGNGSSGLRGTQPRTWMMSAAELRSYGTALLSQSYVCAFSMWQYNSTYYGRADVKSAMADLSALARSHAKTSCKQ